MKTWKKNMIAAAVLLVVCAGIYVNWMYTNDQNTSDLTDLLDAEKVMSDNGLVLDDSLLEDVSGENNTVTDYFAAVRLSRQEAMAYGSDSEVAASNEQLEQSIETALCEAQIESLIIAKGYKDCVAYISESGITVAVAAPEGGIGQQDVAVIADIVITQSGLDMGLIRVVEV